MIVRQLFQLRLQLDSITTFLDDEILQLTKVKRVSKREKMRILQLQMRDIAKTTE